MADVKPSIQNSPIETPVALPTPVITQILDTAGPQVTKPVFRQAATEAT